ncbi:MAG: hypothetical protein AB1646_08335 [Thermodesulfobacteriota bacterium]
MSQGNIYQERYWRELHQIKTHVIYLDEYFLRSEAIDTKVDAVLAVVSSGSIGGWAVWQQYQTLWALIIAASQVVTVLRRFLPYKKRLQMIPGLRRELEELFLFAEKRWYDVSEGILTQQQIHKLQCDIRERKARIQHQYRASTLLPDQADYLSKAKQRAVRYFKDFYLMEG